MGSQSGGGIEGKRYILNFNQASLVIVNKFSSYVELSKPQDDPGGAPKCLFCPKLTTHEHDIQGKVKFDARHNSYLISLISNAKEDPPANNPEKKSLDIIPVILSKKKKILDKAKADEEAREKAAAADLENLNKANQENDTRKTRMISPIVVPDEKVGAKYLAKELNANKFVAGIKIMDTGKIFMLSATPSQSNPGSGLSLLKCPKCDKNEFDSLSELKPHFEDRHKFTSVNIKSITPIGKIKA